MTHEQGDVVNFERTVGWRGVGACLLMTLSSMASSVRADITLEDGSNSARISDAKHGLVLHLRLDERCLIDGISVFGRQVVVPETGVCTGVKIGGEWYTTRSGLSSPRVNLDGDRLEVKDIRFGPAGFPVVESWTFQAADDYVEWTIARSYSVAGELQDTYFPGFDFINMDTWTGGILDTGGVAWAKYLDSPQATYGCHTSSVTFWNKDSLDCMRVVASSPGPAVDLTARFTHQPSNILSFNLWTSDTPLVPAHGLTRFLPDRQDLWRSTPIVASPDHPLKISTTIRLSALPYGEVCSLGDLKGIDARAVRELLNTIARYGVIDRGICGGNGWRSGFTCTHEPWLAEFGLAVADPNLIANTARSLDGIRDAGISPDGRVVARWHNDDGDAMPGTFDAKTGYYEAQWGYLLDSQPCYVICVAEQFDLSGDLAWLRSHQKSCRAALEYMLRRDEDGDGLLEVIPKSYKEERGSDWIDIVWASHENALVNAEMYEAMIQWASLEEVMGDAAQAGHFLAAAEKLKAAFNRPINEGGFWNPDRSWYVYWREPDGSVHGDNLVTPVNFAAIAYGLCDDPDRRARVLDQIESLMQKEGLFHWPLCFFAYKPEEVQARQKVFPDYENGDIFLSWAEVAVRAYAPSDPALALKYIQKVIDRYNADGLSFQRCLRVSAAGSGDDILAGNAMAIVGLYRDIYGVRPRQDRLFVDPHITAALSGTRVEYPLRSTRYSIELSTHGIKVSALGSSVSCSRAFGVDISGDGVRFFPTADGPAELVIALPNRRSIEAGLEEWSPQSTRPRREWSLRSASDTSVTVHMQIAGLPTSAAFDLLKEKEVVAHGVTSASGVFECDLSISESAVHLSLAPAQ